MEIKAKDMCPRCKHCLGMTPQGMYSCGKANDGSELNIGINVVLNCANFEWKDGKVEGKVGDICPKCKNCNGRTMEHDGKTASIRLTEVECEDPYDGMVNILQADSDICCSMFEEKKEKEPFNLNMPRNELKKDHDSWRDRYYEVRYALRKDETLDESVSCVRDIPSDVEMIEDLKKRAAESDYYKEKSELLEERNNNQFNTIRKKDKEFFELEEKLKKANELTDSWKRDYERLRDQFIYPIYNILYPDNPNRDINVTDLLNDVKNLKVYADENGQMYKELREWREKYIVRGNEISKLQNIVTEKDVEIKRLKKEIVNLGFDRVTVKSMAEKNSKLNQTISDQEVTIKALLITIKEMCKEDETNE